MKKVLLFSVIIVCLLAAAMTVSAFDQEGNTRWCNSDADGCWVSGENGDKDYIMFWTEASREKFMGPGSNAPLGAPMPHGKVIMPAPSGAKPTCFTEKSDLNACINKCPPPSSDPAIHKLYLDCEMACEQNVCPGSEDILPQLG